MTSLKINTIEADTTTTFSQVPSISATVTAYPTVGTTIPTTTWVQNAINTLLSPYATVASLSAYAQLSSANFTTLTRGSKQVLTTTRPENIYCQFGSGSVIGPSTAIFFATPFTTACIAVQATTTTGGNIVIRVSNLQITHFLATASTSTFDYVAWGY